MLNNRPKDQDDLEDFEEAIRRGRNRSIEA